MTELVQPPAHFDGNASAVIIEQVTISDADAVREARRWTTGKRGPAVDGLEQLVSADLTNYVTEALRIGAHALSVTGQAQESLALERMLKDVGQKTADSTSKAAELTERVVKEASDAVAMAAGDAKKAITEADAQSRKEFTNAVAAAKQELSTEVRRIFAGENPELLERLQPLLEKFGTALDTRVTASASELLTKAAKQFDPADPTSPMAKHTAELNARQEKLTEQLSTQHAELASKVDELTTALKIREAKTALATVTPIKGQSYASEIHTMMLSIATGLGDEYNDTSAMAGRLPRCRKGDGVLTIDAGAARVVVEMTDSSRVGWSDYLDEAERNRDAAASLGVVRKATQNGGQTIRVIGARRVVMAFDPQIDDPDLLRTVVMLVRTVAITASVRKGAEQIATAEEKINEAMAQLAKIDSVKKLAGAIQKNATKIDGECTSLGAGVRRLLDQALDALAGTDSVASEHAHEGVASRDIGRAGGNEPQVRLMSSERLIPTAVHVLSLTCAGRTFSSEGRGRSRSRYRQYYR